MTWIAASVAGAGVVMGGLKALGASKQAKKDKLEAERLKQPFYKIQDEYLQNKNLAAEQAGQGLATDTKNYLTQEGQRGLGTGIEAVQQGGGGPNDVARLLEGYQHSIGAIGAQDAEMHQKNIDYFMGVNKDLAGQKTTQWTINEYQPYENKLKELTQRRAADEQNKQDGLNTAFGSATAGVIGMQNAGLLKKLFAQQKPGIQDPYTPDRWTNPQTADTRGSVGSPAAGVGSINPDSAPNISFNPGGPDQDISTLE